MLIHSILHTHVLNSHIIKRLKCIYINNVVGYTRMNRYIYEMDLNKKLNANPMCSFAAVLLL